MKFSHRCNKEVEYNSIMPAWKSLNMCPNIWPNYTVMFHQPRLAWNSVSATSWGEVVWGRDLIWPDICIKRKYPTLPRISGTEIAGNGCIRPLSDHKGPPGRGKTWKEPVPHSVSATNLTLKIPRKMRCYIRKVSNKPDTCDRWKCCIMFIFT